MAAERNQLVEVAVAEGVAAPKNRPLVAVAAEPVAVVRVAVVPALP